MNEKFSQYIDPLDGLYRRLLESIPVTVATLPQSMPRAGVYLFSDRDEHLYVGRANNIRRRLQMHCRPSSGHNSASFAFLIARDKTGNKVAAYTAQGSRDSLMLRPEFKEAFLNAKKSIRSISVRFVEETDQVRQALLEIYASVCLGTPYNDFNTH